VATLIQRKLTLFNVPSGGVGGSGVGYLVFFSPPSTVKLPFVAFGERERERERVTTDLRI
jgi:hypothetical protein